MPTLAERYFRPKAFEVDGRLYEWLGVVPFKRALTRLVTVDAERTPGQGYVLTERTLAGVRAFELRSRRSEVIHLSGLLLALLLLFFATAVGSLGSAAAGFVILVANFPCYILQRYNRIRVVLLLARRARRRGGCTA